MVNISSLKGSTKSFSSSVSTRRHSFLSQYPKCITLVILLVGFCPIVFSSPTPSSIDHKNKINYQSNGFSFDPNDYQATSGDDASLIPPSTVHDPLSGSSPFWYVQPRSHANDFLLSHADENEIIVPKWYRKYHQTTDDNNNNNDDDSDDYVPSGLFFNKRSTSGNNHNGGLSNIKKRKQLTKPPMEVMNEIVNSIYLKR